MNLRYKGPPASRHTSPVKPLNKVSRAFANQSPSGKATLATMDAAETNRQLLLAQLETNRLLAELLERTPNHA